MQIYFGIVENRSDPLELGRCQVRVVGLHTHDKNLLPTSDLPWCASMQPVTSAAMNGIGHTPLGPVEGTSVVVTYLDDSLQQGLIMGAVGGIATNPVPIDFDDSGPIAQTDTAGKDVVRLRSIPGPVSGQIITLYDPDYGRTDLTSKLVANMRVSGYGIEYGTVIVSIDSGTQITISKAVRDFSENLIDFEPPLASVQAVVASKTNVTGSTLDQKSDPVKTTAVNTEIPTLPPLPEFKNTQTKASEGIKALIAACDKVGLTTKEQKCALLGIAGGESGWIPQKESFNYSPARLKQIFSFATDEDVAKYANATKNGVTREEFFSWCYGPTKRGKGFMGHKTDEDGGKYYGRGFIQLTGYSNYKKYNDMAQKLGLLVDIVNFPDQLDMDINASAIIAALYIKDRVPSAINANSHPDFFYAAKKAVGVNSPDIAARKLRYYEYFYGKEGGGGVVKDAGAAAPVVEDNAETKPGPSKKSIETGSFGLGFRDPNNKYPLQDYIGESDVNRLARGVIEGTAVKLKDATRKIGIPTSSGATWDQPPAPFGAKYPFNKVYETESGHIQEFDDTPGQERINTYHRSGTYTEIDTNGTQVNYIVGDNFILMEQNGCIHVAGECNITVDGNTNIYARSDANVKVEQNATVTVGNVLEIGSANDTTLAVGGDLLMKVAGSFKVDAGNIAVKSQGAYSTQALGDLSQKGASVAIESEGDADINVAGTFNMNYSEGNFGVSAGSAVEVEDVGLTPPEAGHPLNSVIGYSIAPPREFEEKAVVETPDDWDTPEGRAQAQKQAATEGVVGVAPVAIADEAGSAATGGSNKPIAVDKNNIQNTKDFTDDYRLSKNIVLGMVISGGVGGKHRLTPQMLKPNADAQERLYTVQEIVGNLAESAHNILEPIIDILPGGRSGYNSQWAISSGYRLKGVVSNESPTSDHCKGHCVDIVLKIPDKYTKTFEMIQKIEPLIVYDQLILEYRHPDSVWMHISYRKDNNRKMAFTMVNDKVYKRNAKGLPQGFFLINSIPPKGSI
jgi:predicted chitinase